MALHLMHIRHKRVIIVLLMFSITHVIRIDSVHVIHTTTTLHFVTLYGVSLQWNVLIILIQLVLHYIGFITWHEMCTYLLVVIIISSSSGIIFFFISDIVFACMT